MCTLGLEFTNPQAAYSIVFSLDVRMSVIEYQLGLDGLKIQTQFKQNTLRQRMVLEGW